MNFIELSKEISYALRHAPHEYGLSLDQDGWVNVDALVAVLRSSKKFCSLTVGDIEEMIQLSPKQRHEIINGRIRALYGHSVEKKIVKKTTSPPNILYHGTARKFVSNIIVLGLIPKSRQYVHLSEDIETAVLVGKRRDDKPVVLKIDANKARDEGICFYLGSGNIWLADNIPPKYISLTLE